MYWLQKICNDLTVFYLKLNLLSEKSICLVFDATLLLKRLIADWHVCLANALRLS